MSTNFYFHHDICDCCHRPAEILHIGKSAAGWRFLFRGYPEREIQSWKTWQILISGNGQIYDEYGNPYTYEEFASYVEKRQSMKADNDAYTDEEGHTIYNREFS